MKADMELKEDMLTELEFEPSVNAAVQRRRVGRSRRSCVMCVSATFTAMGDEPLSPKSVPPS